MARTAHRQGPGAVDNAPTRSAGSGGLTLRSRPQPEAWAAGLTLRSRAGTTETIPLRTVRKPFAGDDALRSRLTEWGGLVPGRPMHELLCRQFVKNHRVERGTGVPKPGHHAPYKGGIRSLVLTSRFLVPGRQRHATS
jgi:hypothetical protein